MKQKTINLFKILVKYVLPIVIGWLEGDNHVLQSFLSSIY